MRQLIRGIRLDRGYIQVRIFHKGRMYCKNFGKDSPLARELAGIHLSEKRREILMGKLGIVAKLPRKKFPEVAALWFNIWSKELDTEGRLAHSRKGVKNAQRVLENNLNSYFKNYWYDDIKPKDILQWRLFRLTTVLGTSANREQVVLSSIYSHIKRWMDTERIKPFAIPTENPCSSIEKAPLRKRERILTIQELALLKTACIQYNDMDIWDICKMALKSLLRRADLEHLESGATINLDQAKTGVRVNLPIQVLKPLNYINFNARWRRIQKSLPIPPFQFRDLRKTGANLLKNKNWSNKIISEVLGHTNTRTTEIYMVPDSTHLAAPLNDLAAVIDSI